MNKKIVISLILVIVVFVVAGLVFIKKSNNESRIIASATQFQLGNLEADSKSIDIAKKLALSWQNDAQLTSLTITRIPSPKELKETSYWFASQNNQSKGYYIELNVDNSVKKNMEVERSSGDFQFNNPLETQKIKISSAEAFNLVLKIASDFKLPVYEDNFLSMGLVFNHTSSSYQWMITTAQNGSSTKRVIVVINAETGNIDKKLVE